MSINQQGPLRTAIVGDTHNPANHFGAESTRYNTQLAASFDDLINEKSGLAKTKRGMTEGQEAGVMIGASAISAGLGVMANQVDYKSGLANLAHDEAFKRQQLQYAEQDAIKQSENVAVSRQREHDRWMQVADQKRDDLQRSFAKHEWAQRTQEHNAQIEHARSLMKIIANIKQQAEQGGANSQMILVDPTTGMRL